MKTGWVFFALLWSFFTFPFLSLGLKKSLSLSPFILKTFTWYWKPGAPSSLSSSSLPYSRGNSFEWLVLYFFQKFWIFPEKVKSFLTTTKRKGSVRLLTSPGYSSSWIHSWYTMHKYYLRFTWGKTLIDILCIDIIWDSAETLIDAFFISSFLLSFLFRWNAHWCWRWQVLHIRSHFSSSQTSSSSAIAMWALYFLAQVIFCDTF